MASETEYVVYCGGDDDDDRPRIRSIYRYDIHKKEIISDCSLNPTEVVQGVNGGPYWIHAKNNKYARESIDHKKVGKWMLFLSRKEVDAVWGKIKIAVANGDLWDAKVATVNDLYPNHAIMIYTKDYTDLNDVISVLDFLESSEIKPRNVTIRYKTDQQTSAGIYTGGKQKPWVYTSETIRSLPASTSTS